MRRTGLPAAGLAWLFMGVANSDAKLYDDELQEILATYPDQVSTLVKRFSAVEHVPGHASLLAACMSVSGRCD